ncbi:hypothetical protein NDU88_001670 [Pleurodeles waltl]|uniref:Secreted protein n=1 Tax=Pleurodeles waltl TaxID=8319 RepID=A0AAV7WJ08_PLEWA|nr:hypothetical protein NDU88_001670 [Pleurodeles waltl]
MRCGCQDTQLIYACMRVVVARTPAFVTSRLGSAYASVLPWFLHFTFETCTPRHVWLLSNAASALKSPLRDCASSEVARTVRTEL